MRTTTKSFGANVVKDIKRSQPLPGSRNEVSMRGRRQYSSDEKFRIVLDGLRGAVSIAELCHREGNSQGIYY